MNGWGGSVRMCGAWLALLFLVGCAGLFGRPSEPPRVTLADIGIEEVGLLEQRLRLDLRVQNPNDVAIDIDGLSYELELNGRRLARGVSDRRVQVPRFGEATLRVSAISELASLLRQLPELQRGGRETIGYRLHGRVNLGGIGAVPFDHRGDLTLPGSVGETPPRREGT